MISLSPKSIALPDPIISTHTWSNGACTYVTTVYQNASWVSGIVYYSKTTIRDCGTSEAEEGGGAMGFYDLPIDVRLLINQEDQQSIN